QGHTEDGAVFAHSQTRVDLDRPAAADDHDSPVFGDERQVAIEVDVGGHLDHQIDATAVGRAHDLVGVARRPVIDDHVGPVIANDGESLVGAAAADDAQAVRMCEFHR